MASKTMESAWVHYSDVWSFRISVNQYYQDEAGNYSTCDIQFQALYKLSYGTEMNVDGNYTIEYDGNTFNHNISVPSVWCEPNAVIVLATALNRKIYHNNDGTKTLKVSVSGNMTGQGYFQTVSASFELTPFARKSTISSISGGTIGSNMTVSINKPSSSTTNSVHVRAPGYSWREVVTKSSSTSLSFTLPTSLVPDMPNNTSVTAEVRITTYSGSTSLGTDTKTHTITIPKSTISSVSGGTIGSTMTVNISRIHSNLTTSVWVALGNSGWVSVASKQTSTSISFTVPNSLANQLPNATSGTGSVIIRTHNGSSTVGDTTKSQTFTVPDSMKYSISGVTVESDTTIGGVSRYIKTKSKAKVTISTNSSNAYGATIKEYKFTLDGYTYYGNGTQSRVLNTSGSRAVNVTITDSRGRTATSSTSITVHDYYVPTASISAFRSNSSGTKDLATGTYASVTYSGAVASVDGKNTISITLQYKQAGSSSWTTSETLSSSASNRVKVIGTFDLTKTHEVRVQVKDYYTTTTKSVLISTAEVPFDYRQGGTGIAIGRYCTEDNTVQINKEMQLYSNTGDKYSDLKYLNVSNEKQTMIWRGGAPDTELLMTLYKSTSGTSSGAANLFDLYRTNNVYYRFGLNYFQNSINFYNAEGTQIKYSDSNSYLYFYNPSHSSYPHDICAYDQSAGTIWWYRASSGQLLLKAGYGQSSDERVKHDFDEFEDWNSYYNFYMSLKPLTFKYINSEGDTYMGMKAQDVLESIESNGLSDKNLSLVNYSENDKMDDGKEYSLSYLEFIPLNIKMIQKHENDIKELKDKVTLFKETVKKLKKSE